MCVPTLPSGVPRACFLHVCKKTTEGGTETGTGAAGVLRPVWGKPEALRTHPTTGRGTKGGGPEQQGPEVPSGPRPAATPTHPSGLHLPVYGQGHASIQGSGGLSSHGPGAQACPLWSQSWPQQSGQPGQGAAITLPASIPSGLCKGQPMPYSALGTRRPVLQGLPSWMGDKQACACQDARLLIFPDKGGATQTGWARAAGSAETLGRQLAGVSGQLGGPGWGVGGGREEGRHPDS